MNLFLFFMMFAFGSCSHTPKEKIRLGLDSNWQTPYVLGFVDDLLLEVARDMQVEFVKVPIYSQHDVALSTLAPYTFNQAKYDFSQNILRFGPVLIMPSNVKTQKMNDMKTLGVLFGYDGASIFQKYPDILVRNYSTTAELLNAVIVQDVQGGLLDRIEAVGYTTGVYDGKLKIASLPLNEAGLRLIAEKGKHEKIVRSFDYSITQLKKKKLYKDLLAKWKL